MPSVNPQSLDYEGIHLVQADFTAGKDDSASLAAGTVGEMAVAEIGEDGQLSAYDAVRVGDALGQTGNSSKGKMYVDLQNTTPAALPDDTQFRLVAADKNRNRRRPVTRWFQLRGEDNADPRLRTELPPRDPHIKNGRDLIVEVKNESQSITPSLSDSTFELPSRAGY